MALRSRRDTEMGPAFPEVVTMRLPGATALDGKLVIGDPPPGVRSVGMEGVLFKQLTDTYKPSARG